MTYVLRRLWYVARLLLHFLYGVLHFFGKPGSRILVPLAAAVAAFYGRAWLHQFIEEAYRLFDPLPLDPWMCDAAIVAALIAFAFLYWLASRALEVVLGTFPMMTQPLPPMRPVRAAKRKEIGRAVVRVVVPTLPRRHVLATPQAQPFIAPLPIVPVSVSLAVPPLPRRTDERQAAE